MSIYEQITGEKDNTKKKKKKQTIYEQIINSKPTTTTSTPQTNILDEDMAPVNTMGFIKSKANDILNNKLNVDKFKDIFSDGLQISDIPNTINTAKETFSLSGKAMAKGKEVANNLLNGEGNTFKSSKAFDEIKDTWSDGWQKGDLLQTQKSVNKALLGTYGDVAANYAKGTLQTAEGLVDVSRYLISDVADLAGKEEYADRVRKNAIQNTTGILFGEYDTTGLKKEDGWLSKLDDWSLFGNKLDQISQSVGQQGFRIGLQGAVGGTGASEGVTTALNQLEIFAGSYGSAKSEALANGADYGTASLRGTISGISELISENMFDSIPGFKTAGFAEKAGVKDLIAEAAEKSLGKGAGRYVIRGLNSLGEGVEEGASNFLETALTDIANKVAPEVASLLGKEYEYNYGMQEGQGLSKDNTFGENVKKLFTDAFGSTFTKETGEAFIVAMISTLITGAATDTMTKVQRNQVINQYAQDNNISKEKATKLFDEIRDLRLKQRVESTTGYEQRMEMQDQATKQLAQEINEGSRSGQKIDLQELFDRTPKTRKESKFVFTNDELKNFDKRLANEIATSNINNEEDVHNMVRKINVAQKINKTVQYHPVTTEGLYQLGFIDKDSKGNYTLNGKKYIPRGLTQFGNEIYVNLDVGTKSATQAMFHEMFESFKATSPEQYNKFKQMVVDIVGQETIDNEKAQYKEMYLKKGAKLTDSIEDEIINDKFGELAENQDFINRISDNRNVLEKLIDSVKSMIKYVKGTPEEKEFIKLQNKLEKEFAKRYKETDFSQSEGDTAYSLQNQEQLEQEDWKNITSGGNYDVRSHMGDVLALHNLKAQQDYMKKVGDTTPMPTGEANAKTQQQAQKVLQWYDNSIDASIEALNTYQEELNKFKSDKYRKLIQDQIDFYKNNIDNARENKKWAERTMEKYLTSTDTKYSLTSTKDSQGRDLSPQQQEYFKDSKVVDNKGNLLSVYHGSNSDINVFDKTKTRNKNSLGFYFSPESRKNSVAGYYGNVKEYYLNLTNPLYDVRPYGNQLKQAIEDGTINDYDGVIAIAGEDFGEREFYNNKTGQLETENLKKGDIIELIAFNSNQIKNVDNTNPTTNEDIRYSLSNNNIVYRAGTQTGQMESGTFFAPNKTDADNYGNSTEYHIDKSANLYNGISSKEYAEQNNLMNVKNDVLKDKLGVDTLQEVEDIHYNWTTPSYLDKNPNLYHFAYQYMAKNDLENKGYDGAIWTHEDDLTPQQYQIWNNDKVNNDIRNSLAPTGELSVEDRINQSMTMEEVRKMIDIAFKENQINDWRDDNEKYKNADEWLNDVGTDEVAMYVENGYSTIENYLNPLYDRDNSYGEDYVLEDIIEAYKNGTLTGGTKQQANRLDLTKTGNRLDTRFYSPQNIENIQEVYNTANERVNNNNRDDVYKARGQFVILAHNQENIDNLGLDRQELNKKLKNWAAYSNKALELSNRLNANVDRNNQWAGLENSSIINTASISNEELNSLVKSIEGNNSEWQRHYITSTMLALDTHINYKDLSFQFDANQELNEKNALGDYSRKTKTIRIGRGYQNTVAHEMGHYLDNKWAEDFGFFSTANMTDNLNFKDANVSEDVKQFAKNFKIFMDDIVKGATSESSSNVSYYQDRGETFARFVGKFTEWVKNTASDGRFGYDDKYYTDNFTQRQYEEFVKLLQEKAMLDSTNQTYNAYSLTSNKNISSKEVAPIGTTTDEMIAPIREDISNLSNQLNNLSNQIQTLQNGAEMTSDNEIAPVNPYRARAIAQREANQRAEEMYKDENYWKSIEESAEQVSDLDEKSAKKMSRNIGKELGLKQKQIKDLQGIIQKAFDKGYSLQDIKNELDMQFGHQTVTEKLDEVIDAQKELKNHRIKVSPEIQRDIPDYGYWKQHYFGKINFSNQGSPVDVAYQELSSINPSMYPSDIINPTDQLLRIAEVADMDRKYTIDYEMDRNTIDEAANYINDTIQETLYANAMRQQTDLEKNAMQYNERTKEIPIKKRTRQEVRENLQNTMGITVEDLQVGNDIGSMSYNLTTPERVNEKVFGREVGRKINEQTVFFAKHQEAERIRFLNRELKEIADLGIKARSKESALVQQYGEGLLDDAQLAQAVSDKATQEKIKNAARVLRSKYDTYLDQINEELVDMGYDPIPKRKDYMRHFQELTDKFSQAGIPFNRQALNSENLPTDINGLTEFNVPGKNWFASAQRRTGEKTTYDAITGIDGYLQGASNLMYHTETIQRYRALEKLIRDTYGQTHGLDVFGDDLSSEQAMQRIADIQEGKLSNYAAWLKEQGNALAGKKGALDRGFERALGRRAYTLASELKKQVGSNMTGFNVRSALTNFISSTIAASKTNKLAMVKGTVDTIRNMFNDDGFIDRSDFLTSRLRSDTSISKKTWQKISNAGQILMSGSDWFTSNLITRSKYYEGIQKGMTDAQAMNYANDFAARVMGDRSKGATAEAFNSKTLGFLTQFQLETNNQWQYMIHDTKMEFQENLAKEGGLKAGATILFQVGQLAAYSYLFNEMFEQLTGSRAAFDIADIIKKLFGLDDDDKDKTFEERMKEAGSELVDALPFASLFGSGGRMPIGEMLTPAQTIYDYITGGTNKYGQEITLKDVKKDTLEALPYYVLPTGYGQIKKTAKGLGMYANEVPGSYTDSGNLRFTADTDTGSIIKNALFGQWAGEEAKKYRESGYKTIRANDIQEMQDLNMKSSEYREYKNNLKEAGSKNADKLDYIDSLNIPISQKNIMASNVVNRDVDMSDYTTYEEFDFAYKNPAKYKTMKAIANDYEDYQTYITGIEEVRDKYSQNNGYSTEQRKKKVFNYVNSLNLTIPQKAMLMRQYYSSYKDYNREIVNYVNNLDYDYEDKVEILKSLKIKVDSNGNVSW